MIKKYIPILFIFFVWVLFSYSFFLKQTAPIPSQYQVNFFSPWNSYKEFAGPVKNESMPDVIGQIYPWKHFTIESFKEGFIPLWNPYSFAGTPHLANYQSGVLSIFNLGFIFFKFVDWWSMLVLLQPLLAGIFTYIFVRSLKQSTAASLISSISFMFCGFMTTWMGYATLGYAILFLPFTLFAIEKFSEQKKSRYLILITASIPLSFFSGHFQISLYFLLFALAYIILKFFQTKNVKSAIYVLSSLLFGILLCAPQIFPTIEQYGQSFRSTIFQKSEVIPWGYLPTLLAPDFFGNPVTRNAWFGHYAEWNAYIGLAPLLLALYSLKKIKKTYIPFFFVTGIVSLLLAFDSYLLSFLVFLRIPVLSTSAASRIIILFSFSALVLAGFGLDILIDDVKNKRTKSIFTLLGLGAVLLVGLWVVSILKISLTPEYAAIAKSNLKFPTLIFAGLCVALCIGIFVKSKKTTLIVLTLLVVIVSSDMLRFSTKWMPFDPKRLVYPTVGVVSYYPKIETPYRVYTNAGAENSVYYHLPSIEGYDAVYMRRYGQFIASLDTGQLQDSFRSVVSFPKTGKYTLAGANLLGVKYITHKISDGQNVWEFPFWRYDPKSIKLLFDDKKYQVLENTNAYPRAFLVGEVEAEKDPQKILDKMFKTDKPLSQFAVIEESLQPSEELGSGSAKILSYKPNSVRIQTDSKKPSLLVLTDSYYPGWKATIDGRSTKIYRTDFTFRGVLLPSGAHTVVFKFKPNSFRYGVYTAIIGFIGIAILAVLNTRRKANI